MAKTHWFTRLHNFATAERPPHQQDFPSLPGELLDLYFIAMKMPVGLILRFEGVSDDVLRNKSRLAEQRILQGTLTFDLPTDVTMEREIVLAVAAQLRALDQILYDHQDFGSTYDVAEKWFVKTASNEAFIIPRSRHHMRGSSKSNGRRDIGPFRFRALSHHRILPRSIEGYEVTIREVNTALRKELGHIAYGAAFFRELELAVGENEEEFWVTGVHSHEHLRTAMKHLENAHAEQCSALIYPELTIDPTTREHIRVGISTRPWRRRNPAIGWTVSVIIAGSWHESELGSLVNVATVYDGYGKLIVQHRKLFPYTDPDGKTEKIRTGKALTVLVLEDALIAIGICRDFCERGSPNPFAALDADLFLITSLANESTMRGHLATANDVRIRYRSLSFVVQELYPTDRDFVGYILSPYDDLKANASELKQTALWLACGPARTPLTDG
jgi:hypothetical protein